MRPQELQAHPLWGVVKQIGDALERTPEPGNEEQHHALQRLRAAHRELSMRHDVDAYVMDEVLVEPAHTAADAVRSYLEAWIEDPDESPEQLDAAVTATAQVLSALRDWPSPHADEHSQAMQDRASQFERDVEAMVRGLSRSLNALSGKLRDIDDQAGERATEATAKLEELSADIVAAKDEVSSLATRLTNQIESHSTAFDAESTARTAAFDTAVAEYDNRAGEALNAREEAADAVLDRLGVVEGQARVLLDSMSRHAIAGDYGKWAARQARIATIWTISAVAVGLLTGGALFTTFDNAAADSIQFTLYKTGVSLIGLIVAGYCARQAAEHRGEERRAKRLHLDLNALEPFLANVDDPGALRTQVAERVFAPQETRSDDGPSRSFIQRGLNLTEITQLIAVIRGVPPSGPGG